MIEEPEEERLTLKIESYISSEESIMAGRGERGEGEGEILNGENVMFGGGRGNAGGGRRNREIYVSFGFPIVDGETNATMKNISPFVLPNFHGLKSEDPETFLSCGVIMIIYKNLKKLKLFPSTLKGETLKWFMGLVTQSIRTWNDMKK